MRKIEEEKNGKDKKEKTIPLSVLAFQDLPLSVRPPLSFRIFFTHCESVVSCHERLLGLQSWNSGSVMSLAMFLGISPLFFFWCVSLLHEMPWLRAPQLYWPLSRSDGVNLFHKKFFIEPFPLTLVAMGSVRSWNKTKTPCLWSQTWWACHCWDQTLVGLRPF